MAIKDIKFRGKRIDNGEWVHGNLIKMDAQGSQSFIFPFRNFASTLSCGQIVAYNMVEVDPATVGQYTGLKDSKRTEEYPEGQEIYEGDICVHLKNPWGITLDPFRVAWDENNSCWSWMDLETGESDMVYQSITKSCELIGNIHDNPELLEVR